MSKWALRFAVASSVTSLAVSGVTLGLVLRRPAVPAAASASVPGAAAPAHADSVSAPSEATPPTALGGTGRSYLVRDPAKQKPSLYALPDEAPRLERFIVQAKLSRAQELSLRDHFLKHIEEERALATRMVSDGRWSFQPFSDMTEKFWGDEIEALPPAQTEAIDSSYFPRIPVAGTPFAPKP
jgi:hypothetical protein